MQLILIIVILLITNTISKETNHPYLMAMFPPDSETKFDLGKKCNLTSIRDYLCSEDLHFWPCKITCVLEAVGLMENNTFLINEANNNIKQIHPDFDNIVFRAFVMTCEAEKSSDWDRQDGCKKTRNLFYCLIRNNNMANFWGISEDCFIRRKKVDEISNSFLKL